MLRAGFDLCGVQRYSKEKEKKTRRICAAQCNNVGRGFSPPLPWGGGLKPRPTFYAAGRLRSAPLTAS